jgi:hypothetical protein
MSAVAAAMAAAASVKNSSDQTALIYHASIDNSDTQDADIGIEREDLQSNLEAAQTVDPEYVSFDAASHYAGGKILVLGAGNPHFCSIYYINSIFNISLLILFFFVNRWCHWSCTDSLSALERTVDAVGSRSSSR